MVLLCSTDTPEVQQLVHLEKLIQFRESDFEQNAVAISNTLVSGMPPESTSS